MKVESPKKKKAQPLYTCTCPEEFTGQDCEIGNNQIEYTQG